jgi:hypothetical protein
MAQMAAHPFVSRSIFTVVANGYLRGVVRVAGVHVVGVELSR